MNAYIVMVCKKDVGIEIFGNDVSLSLCWSDGMIGAAPIFSTREDAERYAEGSAVLELSMEK